MDQEQLFDTKVAMDHLGICFSHGYCRAELSICSIRIGSSRTS